jgi:hypothetical protein
MKRLAALVAVAAIGCSRPSLLVQRPADQTLDHEITRTWSADIARVARDGDWILSRSYYVVGDVIAVSTNTHDELAPDGLSHASIYDASRGTVIEAVSSGVREIPLAELVSRNHYLLVVRPSGMSADDQRSALARARGKLGAKFDIAGMFGLDHAERFYCSELVYWASQTEARSGTHEAVVTPADLMKYGEVVYWSGRRAACCGAGQRTVTVAPSAPSAAAKPG